MNYIPAIGLETHVQLKTESKLFCGCANSFGNEPNTLVCPVCLGLPGALPVLNKKTVEFAVRTAAALNCRISEGSVFARKNYFYPDLPKGYQISQYEKPLAQHGWIEISGNSAKKKIGIRRIHLEEDAGKMLHPEGDRAVSESKIDLNRCGVPLVEIVTEPELNSPQEAFEFLSKLKQILLFTGVSDCNMDEGSLRCDANISLRPEGSEKMGNRTELKNLNSFRFVKKALEHEIIRQEDVLDNGEKISQKTLAWDESQNDIIEMRSKEESEDYRYFSEPDLIPLDVNFDEIKRIRKELPELPDAKTDRFISEYNIPEENAVVLTTSVDLADYFEEAAGYCTDKKKLSNWILSELLNLLNEKRIPVTEFRVTPEYTARLVNLIGSGKISGRIAKNVFLEMAQTGNTPENIIRNGRLEIISDPEELESKIDDVLISFPDEVNAFKSGKERIFGFLIGQVMKSTKGKADPVLINRIMKEKLEN
ncbi:MAG: Asp-tRNA(Asn)/Glu-tRNA(Gln) amidotransferase subunit GatB [bacterium]|nr:Asp-tRNA(Asn)/Glu-tRNA(Gln) amidotransferase subunit GatB [bacterium]